MAFGIVNSTARRIGSGTALGCALWTAGCNVGPNFHKPEMAMPNEWESLQPQVTDGSPVVPTPQPTELALQTWWTTFGDDQLTSLIDRALEANLDLQVAEARIREARGLRMVAGGRQLPNVDAVGSGGRAKTRTPFGDEVFESTGDLFLVGLDAAWEIDVFGGTRRSVEAADSGILSAVENLYNTQVSLAGEVAFTYFQIRGAQERLLIARQNLEAQERSLALTRERFNAGYVGGLDVANAQAQVASTSSTIPGFEAAIRAGCYAMAVLLGQQPSAVVNEMAVEHAKRAIPAEVPVGLPSELLERRPDIRRAEAQLHAATAQIGAATADLYPKFALTGSVGILSPDFSGLGTIANNYWSFGGLIQWNVFNGGRIRGNIEIQKAQAEAALAVYQQTVLVALQDVETSMVNFAKEQQRRDALARSVDANRQAASLSQELYKYGKADFLDVLNAQARLLESQDAMSFSEQLVATNLVALYKAIGGGWVPEPAATTASAAQ